MTSIDRATELADEPDLWPIIRQHLDDAITHAVGCMREFGMELQDDTNRADLISAMEAKWRAGEKEHGRDWLAMSRQQLTYDEIRAEAIDMVLYHAMGLARFSGTL